MDKLNNNEDSDIKGDKSYDYYSSNIKSRQFKWIDKYFHHLGKRRGIEVLTDGFREYIEIQTALSLDEINDIKAQKFILIKIIDSINDWNVKLFLTRL